MQYGYDNAGRLAWVVHRGGKVFNVAYGHDAAGNPTQVAETGVPLSGTMPYSYDALHGLVGATYPDSSTAG